MGFDLEIIREELGLTKEQMRDKICDFEEFLNQQEGSFKGSVYGNEEAPIEHEFGKGLYVRQITMPKGMLLTSKIHKYRHPFFVLRGECTVITDDKSVKIKAPYWGMTEPCTKRILYIHEETIWITVHATRHKDLRKIEEEIILPSFDNVITYEFGGKKCLS